MRCAQCHHLNPEGARHCTRCGAPLGAPVAAPPGSDSTALAVGERVGERYVVELVLGTGGMSAVYQVYDLVLGRRVALKVLNEALAQNWKARERLSREATALARLRHPNVIQIYNVLDLRGSLAIELELITGGTLASAMERGQLPVEFAVAIMDRVLDGLAAIHREGLIHRDLKPGNVLMTPEGVPKIADLGIARDPSAELLTAPGAVLGTPEYMSPEQVRGVEIGPESDLYACGIILFELFAGRLPFEATRDRDMLAAQLGQPPALDALPPGLPVHLRHLVARALEKQPERRWRSAEEMRAALLGAAAAPAEPVPQAYAPPPAIPGVSEGARVGEYQVLRLVGEGGMGRVYEAEERLTRRRVALKVLRSEIARSDAGRRLFLNEMELLAQLDHPNIVRSLACSEVNGELVMALELLNGQTLRQRLGATGPLEPEHAIDVALQIASALDRAHSMQPPVVHRDLKPENVMLLADGTVKVMDFGIAKVLDAVSRTATLSVGTLAYMSPEQIDARPVDARSDLYCLGLVLYEMLAGAPPFASESQRELLNRQCTERPPELPPQVRERIPSGVERLVFHLLEKAPADRPPSARAVIQALEPFVSQGTLRRSLTGASLTGTSLPRAEPPYPGAFAAPMAGAVTAARAPVSAAPRAGVQVPVLLALLIVVVLSACAGGTSYVARVLSGIALPASAGTPSSETGRD